MVESCAAGSGTAESGTAESGTAESGTAESAVGSSGEPVPAAASSASTVSPWPTDSSEKNAGRPHGDERHPREEDRPPGRR
jgi:hypothetical protein